MGIIQKGILGGFSGKVGPVVGANWRGMDVMRSLPKKTDRPATERQLLQRARFSVVAKFMRPLRPLLRLYFGKPAAEKSKSNLATAYHMTEAIKGDFPDYEIDCRKVIVSKGELLGLEALTVVPERNAVLTVSWTDNSGDAQAKTTDTVTIVAYNESVKQSKYLMAATTRTISTYSYDLPDDWAGDTVHCWVIVASENDKLYSNSEYFGPLVLL